MKRIAWACVMVVFTAFLAEAQGVPPTADAVKRGLTDKDFPRRIALADNVYGIEILPSLAPNAPPGATRVTTNSLVVVTAEGVLVADGQGSPEAVNKLVTEIRKLTTKPVRYVVVCSEHPDHTGGLAAFPQDATFVASRFSQHTFELQAKAPDRTQNSPPVVVPSESVDDRKLIMLGGTEIQVLKLGRSHTGGDLVVYLPKEKVLWMSETFNPNRFPTMRVAFPSEWVKAIDAAQLMDVRYYAGAHGFIDDAATMTRNLADYRRALEALIAETTRLHQPGAAVDTAFKQANFGPYASWTDFEAQAPVAFRRVWDELDGRLK